LRVFAVHTPNGYMVMPGALTRVAPHDGDVVSMQWGGSSKDTWLLADRPVVRMPLYKPRLGVEDVTRSVVDIASRVGENLYWMGRYAERCEGLARLLRAGLVRMADGAPDEMPALDSLTVVIERLKVFSNREADGKTIPPRAPLAPPSLVAAVVDPAIVGGLAANVHRLQNCASHVRERMSTDNWHVFNRMQQRLPGPDASLGVALESLDETMMACVSLAGFAMDDMTRDESWQFLLLGRRLERLAHLSGVITHVLALGAEGRGDSLEWLLEAANSIVTFRARYRREPELLPVLHLVVFDETNPHAIAFQLIELDIMLERVSRELGPASAPLVSSDELRAIARRLHATPLSGFEQDEGEALEKACADLRAMLVRTERAAFGLSYVPSARPSAYRTSSSAGFLLTRTRQRLSESTLHEVRRRSRDALCVRAAGGPLATDPPPFPALDVMAVVLLTRDRGLSRAAVSSGLGGRIR
jgi:uncharacterized alpha-E superfamily protein